MALPAAYAFGTATLGTLGNIIGANQQAAGTRAMANAIIQGQKLGMQERQQAYDDVLALQNPYLQAGERGLSEYMKAPSSVAWTPFDSSGYTVDRYLGPSMAYQQEQMRKQLEASAAAGGPGLRSGAFATELQKNAANLAQTDYANAFNRMTSDRQFGYADYLNKYNQQRQQIMDDMNKWGNMVNLGQGATNTLTAGRLNLGNQQALTQGNMGAAQGMGNAAGYMASGSNWANVLSPSMTVPFASYLNSSIGQPQQVPQVTTATPQAVQTQATLGDLTQGRR